MPIETLHDVRQFIRQKSRDLDPNSRYITELIAIVEASHSVDDLVERLAAGCRGRYWAGGKTFEGMTLEEKLLVNLITNETSLMRFELAEFEFLRAHVIPTLEATPGRVLSLPCSHGEEPVSLAIEFVEAGYNDFCVRGLDVQPACIETARSGRIPLSGLPRYVVGLVDDLIMDHLRFDLADAFTDDLGGPYDFIVCRNFLGYFTADAVVRLLERLVQAMDVGSYLLADRFITERRPECFARFPLEQSGSLPYFVRRT